MRGVPRRRGAATLLAVLIATPAAALDLDALLACREAQAFERSPGEIASELAADPRTRCRHIVLTGGSTMECELTASRTAFGLPTREFSVSRLGDGIQRVRLVFRAGDERTAAAVASARGVRFERDADGRRVADGDGAPIARFLVERREDDSSVLVCEAGVRDTLAVPGVDAAHGGITGDLAFPGGRVPPMRVCAVPAGRMPARCVRTAAGAAEYLIGGLVPGEYYLLAYPQADNPNRFTAAYTSRFRDCPPNRTDCAHGVLLRVYVAGGQVLTDIDPDAFYTELPPYLAEPGPEADVAR